MTISLVPLTCFPPPHPWQYWDRINFYDGADPEAGPDSAKVMT